MKQTLQFTVLTFFAVMPAAAEIPRGGGCAVPSLGVSLGIISSVTATPGTISFQANNPDSGVVSGSTTATVGWTVTLGSRLLNWTISVQASSLAFTGCPTVPVSAVRAICTSAGVSGGGGTGTCSGPVTLSTLAQQVASGSEGDLIQSYLVILNYTLAESWRYVASSSCTLTLTYTINAP